MWELWLLTTTLKKFGRGDNPWNRGSEISCLSCARALKVSEKPEGLLSREGDPIIWVVQNNGEEGCSVGLL